MTGHAMSLADAYHLALEKDAQLASAKAKLEASEEMTEQAFAQLLPQITASLAGKDESYQLPNNTRNFSEQTQTRNIQLTQAVYNRQALKNLEQAGLKVDYARLRQAGMTNELGVRVAQAYLNLLYAQENRALSQQQIDSVQQRLTQVMAALKMGYSTKVDQLSLQAELDDAKARLLADEQQWVFFRQKLKGLIGEQPPEQLPWPKLDANHLLQQFVVGKAWLEDALASSPNVQMSKVAVQVAEQDIEVRRSAFYPTVSAGLSYNDVDGATYFAQKNDNRLIFLEMRMPLYQGGYDTSRVKEGRALLKSAQEDARYAEIEATQQAQEQLSAIRSDREKMEALAQAIVSGESYLASAEEGYRLGVRDITEVSRAKERLFANRRDMVRVSIELLNSLVQLHAIAGQLDSANMSSISQAVWR
jgi:TolC family type I secretion outer membrane protein